MTSHDIKTIDKKIEKTRFRGEPVVVVSLEDWKKIEDLMEDEEARNSALFQKSIKESRKEIKLGNVFTFNPKTGRFKKGNAKK